MVLVLSVVLDVVLFLNGILYGDNIFEYLDTVQRACR